MQQEGDADKSQPQLAAPRTGAAVDAAGMVNGVDGVDALQQVPLCAPAQQPRQQEATVAAVPELPAVGDMEAAAEVVLPPFRAALAKRAQTEQHESQQPKSSSESEQAKSAEHSKRPFPKRKATVSGLPDKPSSSKRHRSKPECAKLRNVRCDLAIL